MKTNNTRTEDKHKRIIKAALKVFAKKGFYNSKVSEIARGAVVADGTIYIFFILKIKMISSFLFLRQK